MNILRVITSMDPAVGGPCQGIRNSIPEHDKLGHKTEVVSLDDPDSAFLGKDGFRIIPLGPSNNPWSRSAALIPWLIENLAKYDVVIVHGLWLFNSYAVNQAVKKLLAKNPNASLPKIAVMPHGMLDPFFKKAKGRKLKAIRNWFYWKLLESKVVNEADALLFTCEAELELARIPFKPYRPKKEINVSYGVPKPPSLSDTAANAFLEKYPALKNQTYLLFLSRINYKKGVDLLIKGYEQILKESVGRVPKLVIAGPGLDSPYGLEIKKLVEGNEALEKNILFPGMLQGDLKWGAFYGAEAFILPSHQENFGIAVVEALATGTPVLISNQVNIWHEIVQGNGGMVEDDTLEGVTKLLKNWTSLSETDVARMKSNALNVYNTNFAIEPAAKKLSDELIKLVQTH